jgi:hypothetical protein
VRVASSPERHEIAQGQSRATFEKPLLAPLVTTQTDPQDSHSTGSYFHR